MMELQEGRNYICSEITDAADAEGKKRKREKKKRG